MRYTRILLLVLLAGWVIPDPGIAVAARRLQQQGEEQERPALAIPQGYLYDPAGRRDPFVDPVPVPVVEDTRPVTPSVRPPGLPGVLLNEIQLVGIVISAQEISMNTVVIVAPGNRTFFGKPGDEMLDVVIRVIRADEVVFEVKPVEGRPEPEEPQEVVRRLSATPGE